MNHTITTIYYLCDEFLKAIRYRDDPQKPTCPQQKL